MQLFDDTTIKPPADTGQLASKLINKILAVAKTNVQRIPAEDLAFLDGLQSDFDKVSREHDIYEMIFRSKLEESYSGHYKIERRRSWSGNGNLEVEINDAGLTNNFSGQLFLPSEPLEKLFELRDELFNEFLSQIIAYFNLSYELDIEKNDTILKELVKARHYTPVIDWIFTQVPAAGLKEQALTNLMEGFRIYLHGKAIKAEKSRLVFKQLKVCGYSKLDDKDKTFKQFFGALGYFETREPGSMLTGNIPIGQYTDYSTVYELGGEKIKQIKFYQNGKGQLYFDTPVSLDEFVQFFNIKLTTF